MRDGEKQRFRRLMKLGLLVLCAGLAYAFVLIPLGVVIPCPYRLLTGRLCPGCGVTRLCLSLLHGDLQAAYGYNRGLFLALPALAVLVLTSLYRYVRQERARPWTGILERVLSVGLIIWFVLWGILRNQYGM